VIPDSALGLLGLAARARVLLVGTAAVREGVQQGRVYVVVLAGDRSPRTRDKIERLARARAVPVVVGPPAAELGRRIGHGTVQAVGVTDPSLAEGFLAKAGGRSAGG
jgi:ribosomal protein L7Ae-like RNA K-turn-binding protein